MAEREHQPSKSTLVLATLLATAALAHFIAPDPYVGIIPKVFPIAMRKPLVYVSGIAELLLAAGLIPERTRKLSATLTILFFIAVWPANIQMAIDAGSPLKGFTAALSWLRVPLQIPLLIWTWRVRQRNANSVGRQSVSVSL